MRYPPTSIDSPLAPASGHYSFLSRSTSFRDPYPMSAMKRDVLIVCFIPSFLSFHHLHVCYSFRSHRTLGPPCRHYIHVQKKMSLTETVERRTEQSKCVSSSSPSPHPRSMQRSTQSCSLPVTITTPLPHHHHGILHGCDHIPFFSHVHPRHCYRPWPCIRCTVPAPITFDRSPLPPFDCRPSI
jgi:hypothetical protein